MLIYVDNFIAASADRTVIDILERTLKREFEIKILGDIRCYLALDVERNETGDNFISHFFRWILVADQDNSLPDNQLYQ